MFGFGEKKTPEAFRNACHRFVFTEVLRDQNAPEVVHTATSHLMPSQTQPLGTPSVLLTPPFPEKFLMEALDNSVDDSGWSHLGAFGGYLQKIQPDFDTRLHGFKKLSDLVRGRPDLFETEGRLVAGTNHKVMYVRSRKGA